MTRYIRNMCRIEWVNGNYMDVDDIVEPAHAASNGDTWALSRLQMRDVLNPDGTPSGETEPTGRTERIDQLTECTVIGDETDPFLQVTGQSTYLAATGLPEEDRQVVVKIYQNPRFA